jgi:hypothetical protein
MSSSEDVVREARIQEMSQAVFSASPLGALGGYISLSRSQGDLFGASPFLIVELFSFQVSQSL